MAMSPSCDFLGSEGKWRNLQKRRLSDFVAPSDLARWFAGRKLDAVFHLGAISETTATDGDLVIDTNFRLSLTLLEWCAETRCRSSTPPRPRPMATARAASTTMIRSRRLTRLSRSTSTAGASTCSTSR